MVERLFEGLRPVGGFSEIARRELPDLGIERDEQPELPLRFEANIYVRFKDKRRTIEGLVAVLLDKLQGRQPTVDVDGDDIHGFFLLVGFRIAGDDDVSERMVAMLKAKLESSMRAMTEVLDSHADIYDLSEEDTV